jgi:hypothetical protein
MFKIQPKEYERLMQQRYSQKEEPKKVLGKRQRKPRKRLGESSDEEEKEKEKEG